MLELSKPHIKRRPLFALGQLLTTPGALRQVGHEEIALAIFGRHVNGDWGDLCADDRQANEDALKNGDRILSSYLSAAGTKFWIITEADRAATTALLPEEY